MQEIHPKPKTFRPSPSQVIGALTPRLSGEIEAQKLYTLIVRSPMEPERMIASLLTVRAQDCAGSHVLHNYGKALGNVGCGMRKN